MSEVKSVSAEMVAALKKPLPPEAIKQHPTKAYLSAIKVPFIIERLNEVFGVAGWKVRNDIVEAGDKMIVVKSTLTVPEYGIEHEAFGGNDNPDRGDAYKGACTDALSKIASYLYIAMDVYKGLGDAPSREAKKKEAAKSSDPIKVRGKFTDFMTKETESGTEVLGKVKEYAVFSGVDPSRTKLIDLHESGLDAEFVIMPTERTTGKGTALFSVHMVSPIPTQVPDDKLKPAMAVSIKTAKEVRQ